MRQELSLFPFSKDSLSIFTDALERGVPIATVAELLGHTTTNTITKHYSHLSEKSEHLREAAVRATRPKSA